MYNFPLDIIYYILTFDERFIIRNNKLIIINKISSTDNRYLLLKNIPLVKQFPYNQTYDYLPCNRGIVSLGYKNNIKFYIKIIHFLYPIDREKEILHSFNKLKLPKNYFNCKPSDFIYEWIDSFII